MSNAGDELDSLLAAHRACSPHLPAPAASRFTRAEIIAAIKRWSEQYGAPPTVFDWDPAWARRRGEDWRAERFDAGDWPTVAIVRRQFGNMSRALVAADMRPRRSPTRGRPHTLSDDEILDAIREWHRLYGEPPATSDWAPARARSSGQLWRLDRYYAGTWPSTNTVIRRFGTFTEAVRRAGFEPRPRGRHTSPGGKLPPDTREIIRQQLETPRLTCGPAVLAARVRGVAAARSVDDPVALRGALIDLAASALSWADVIRDGPTDVALTRAA